MRGGRVPTKLGGDLIKPQSAQQPGCSTLFVSFTATTVADTNAAAVRSAGCSWTAWKDAQDAGGFEMFAGRSRIGRPNAAVLMVRDAQCVWLPKAASICGASNANFGIKGTLATLYL